MAVRAILLILGAFHLGNGVWMLLAPADWYAAIPGVRETGPFNHHFILDIALAFIASGAGLMLGALARSWSPFAAVAGATWPALHALFHLWIWITHGLPTATPQLTSEAVGVMGVAALGVAFAWARLRQQGVS